VCGDRLRVSESAWCAYLGEYWYALWLSAYICTANGCCVRRQSGVAVLVVVHKRKDNGKELDQSNIRLRCDPNSLRKE